MHRCGNGAKHLYAALEGSLRRLHTDDVESTQIVHKEPLSSGVFDKNLANQIERFGVMANAYFTY